jgi:hypothetical protein
LTQDVEGGVASPKELFALGKITKDKYRIEIRRFGVILHNGLKGFSLQRCKEEFLIAIFLENKVNRPIAKAADSIEKDDRFHLLDERITPLLFEVVEDPFTVNQQLVSAR